MSALQGSRGEPQRRPHGQQGRWRQDRPASGRCRQRRCAARPFGVSALAVVQAALLVACSGEMPRPLPGLNRQLEQLAPARSPQVSGRWLVLIGQQAGRDRVVLVDLERGLPVPLPGLDRADAQPVAVAVDGMGERLAVVRQRQAETELVIYRRSLQISERVPMQPAGVPRRLSLQADGRQLALEVSRGGRWQVDLITIP